MSASLVVARRPQLCDGLLLGDAGRELLADHTSEDESVAWPRIMGPSTDSATLVTPKASMAQTSARSGPQHAEQALGGAGEVHRLLDRRAASHPSGPGPRGPAPAGVRARQLGASHGAASSSVSWESTISR